MCPKTSPVRYRRKMCKNVKQFEVAPLLVKTARIQFFTKLQNLGYLYILCKRYRLDLSTWHLVHQNTKFELKITRAN